MTFESALYTGAVMHRRLRPVAHQFRYRAFWLLIDLDELPLLAARLRLLSRNRFNLFAVHDADHGDGSATPLRNQAERILAQAEIDIAGGPISLLCMPRTLGYSFNPISIYFCHRTDGELAAIVYEVHNTFGERHSYVSAVESRTGTIRQTCSKAFHVSPFMDMELVYDFRLSAPAERIAIGINASKGGQRVLNACLVGARRELSDGALLRLFFAVPLITAKVTLAIHWEALRLWLKGMRLRNRPPPPARRITVADSISQHRKSHVA
ncbi:MULTISPECIES: DUF1365 domain-containing protein [unclassified Bradyrhizobium]|uniref:DUF1365 domain-containing protein n=1 Tax=unclassified Bradyrhizobium TaxID=2631580 RepID=UPI001BADE288|nr:MULTISPECIES: DUF1365 domain-containing protein [unclassified Bradyrhizobium]MBR1154051.1 DUF1365 domain-containing protein [Bradyrhizobium sp. JYMT SZCCT0428]MBR1230291.1 DUF1365 domain-containing protein [Bradyrhizobium sp. AUGA SZCCT0176]MBR1302313.1 DUF1365 domain-containing protein [Bradyrhizobium sp. AUGA SZCCT0042]